MFLSNKVKEKDLVCGMEITVNDSTLKLNYKGKDYYFCSSDCLEQFERAPGKFVPESDDCCQKGEHEHHHHGTDDKDGHCCGGKGHGHHQHHKHCCHEHR